VAIGCLPCVSRCVRALRIFGDDSIQVAACSSGWKLQDGRSSRPPRWRGLGLPEPACLRQQRRQMITPPGPVWIELDGVSGGRQGILQAPAPPQ
jgi:hypothetical protein